MSLGRIASYELIELLGKGGMGAVFKARDSRLDRVVALKTLPHEFAGDRERRARFLREARAEAALSHPSIAACYDLGEAAFEAADPPAPGLPLAAGDLTLYLVMEYVPGEDLVASIQNRPLPIARVLELAIQIAAGLEAAHTAGVVHRDLKPANIRVTPSGQVKIFDFGLARVLDATRPSSQDTTSLTSSTRMLGTWGYMAPEQAGGNADARSDLFSFGIVLYQMVTGHLPFTGNTPLAALYAATNETPPPLARYAAAVPGELERIVRKLLEKRPERRYQSAHEVRTDLETLRDERIVRHRWRRAGWVAAAAALAVAAMAALWARFGNASVHSVAVTPFENRTGDPRLDDIGEGLAAELTGDLVRRTHLNVASFASVLNLGPKYWRPHAVSHELGVQAVLSGILRRGEDGAVLDVELVDGAHEMVLWTDRLNWTSSNAPDIEDTVLRGIAQRITGREPLAEPVSGPHSASAYEDCLQARARLDDPDDPLGAERAAGLFRKALAAEPGNPTALAGLSEAEVRIWRATGAPDALQRAQEAAAGAVRVHPERPESHVALAGVYRETGRTREAIGELQSVLQINPHLDEAQIQLAAAYRAAGDFALAEQAYRKAVELRPGYWRNWNGLGAQLARRGDYDGARAAFREVIRLVPEKNRGYEQLAAIESKLGNYAAALEQYERLPAPVQDGVLASNIGSAYFFENRSGESRGWYQRALDLDSRTAALHQNLADWYVRAGRGDSARAEYAAASRLIDDLLAVNPAQPGLWIDRGYCEARLGDCAAATASLARANAAADADADHAHQTARVHAVCGQRTQALQWLRRARALGIPSAVIRAEDEFAPYREEPAFRALLASTTDHP